MAGGKAAASWGSRATIRSPKTAPTSTRWWIRRYAIRSAARQITAPTCARFGLCARSWPHDGASLGPATLPAEGGVSISHQGLGLDPDGPPGHAVPRLRLHTE